MVDTIPTPNELNRAGRRAAARKARVRKVGAAFTAFPAALGTTALILGATAAPAGAVATTFTVTKLADTNDGTCDSDCSLREAVNAANTNTGADTIDFAPALTGTIDLGSQLDVTDSVTITGPGATVIAVDGQDTVRIFHVDINAGTTDDFTISGLTLQNGFIDGSGAAIDIDNADTLTIRDTVFDANTASSDGGGVYISSSSYADVVIAGSAFDQNSAGEDGGALAFYNVDSVTITGSTFTDNTAADDGGAFYLWNDTGAATISASTFTGNSSGRDGGAFWIYEVDGGVAITGSTFTSNEAGTDGGDYDGGAIFETWSPSLTISGSTFVDNTAYSDGGALHVYGYSEGIGEAPGSVTITGSTFTGNTATNYDGGAISIDAAVSFVMSTTTVSGNQAADQGGAIYLDDVYGQASISNSTISGNSAGEDGGGVWIAFAYHGVDFFNSTISGNSAGGEGGAIFLAPFAPDGTVLSSVNLVQTTVTANKATTIGGIAFGAAIVEMADGGKTGAGSAQNSTAPSHASEPERVHAHEVENANTITLSGTINALNSGSDIGTAGIAGTAIVKGSLFGTITGVTLTNQGGNQQGVNPLLGALADNGGPTKTHALLPGSPAIDAGPNPLTPFPGSDFDQRGDGYARVVAGIVDVGAFEVQPVVIQPTFTG